MVLEILTLTDRTFGHFGPFGPPNNPKNQNFEKLIKNFRDVIILHASVPKITITCYIIPEIWCVTNVIFILHFGLFFALLPPTPPTSPPLPSLTAQKIKIKKKIEKKPLEISSFYICFPKIMIT